MSHLSAGLPYVLSYTMLPTGTYPLFMRITLRTQWLPTSSVVFPLLAHH